MIVRSRAARVAAILTAVAFAGMLPLNARREYSEQELTARIHRENDAVKKSKYQMQLGRLKLHEAMEAYGKNEPERGEQLLNAFLEKMNQAWATLEKSGREAVRKPQGFRELDIALREDERLLQDLKQRTPYLDRAPVEKVAAAVGKLHDEVLQALFPSMRNQTWQGYTGVSRSRRLFAI